jgi:hypothetical protein
MTSGRIFFTIVGISFVGLIAASLAPVPIKSATRPWQLLICNGRDCPPGWPSAVVSHAISKTAVHAHRNKSHKA